MQDRTLLPTNFNNMRRFILAFMSLYFIVAALSGCREEKNYENSESIKLAQLAQDSMIRSNPRMAEILINDAKAKAKDSTEYYYSEVVRSALLQASMKSDSVFYCVNRINDFCKRLPRLSQIHYKMLMLAENNKGIVLLRAFKTDSAIIAYNKALEYSAQSGYLRKVPDIYINLGDAYFKQNNFPMQAQCYRSGLFICDSLNVPETEKYIFYSALGYNYLGVRDFEQAKEYLDKAYALIDRLPLQDRFYLLNYYVNYYYFQEDYATAWTYLMKIVQTAAPQKDEMPFDYAILKCNYADLCIKLGRNLDEAEECLNESKSLFTKFGNESAINHIETFYLLLALKKQDIKTAQQIVSRFEKEKVPNIEADFLKTRNAALIEYYQKTHDYSKAFFLLQENVQIEDSLRGQIQKSYVADLNMRYTNDTKLLKNQMTISNQENKIKMFRLGITLGAVIFIGLIVYFTGYLRRIKKNRQRLFEQHLSEISKLKMQNIREKISPHFTFNVLNSEIRLHQESAVESQRLIQLTKLLRKGLDLSNSIAVSLSEELDFVSTYVGLLQETSNQFTFQLHEEGNIRKEEIKVPSMIIQIPVENAIKHGFVEMKKEACIHVLLKDVQTGIEIIIRNNGRKYSPFTANNNKYNTGTGLKVIYQSIMLMNTRNKEQITFDIRNDDDEGTVVSIYIPYQYTYEW